MAIIDSAFPSSSSSSFDDTCLYVWYTQQERENRTNWECDGAERPYSRKGGQKLHWIHWIRVDSFPFFLHFSYSPWAGPPWAFHQMHVTPSAWQDIPFYVCVCVGAYYLSEDFLLGSVDSVPCLTWTIDHLILWLTIFVYFFVSAVYCLLVQDAPLRPSESESIVRTSEVFKRSLWFVRKWASVTPSGRLHPEAVALWWRMPDYLNSLIPSLV